MKILLADDHPVVRRGLRQLLSEQQGFHVVAEVASGDEVLSYLARHRCDVVVLDLGMPGMNGLEALTRLRREHPGVAVLVLSIYPEDEFALRTIRAGALGYVSKEASPDELALAVRRVASGARYVSSRLADRLADELAQGRSGATHERLSDREFQVLRLLAGGQTVSEVARRLSLSVKTVSTHRANILRKLGLRTTASLMKYALDHGLL